MDSPVASLPLITPSPGFICGTLPVPTATGETSKELVTVQTSSIKVVRDSSGSLRYNFLPTEMDLNALPANWLKQEELVLLHPHLLAEREVEGRDLDDLCTSCSSHSLAQPLPKKCEDLAVNGLAAYGDEIDFIAPASVMKQIFKTPYSKAPLSVAVHRIGKTLILNDGPDAHESKTKQTTQTMTVNKDLFYKFVHHSVNTAAPQVDSDGESAKGAPQENPCRAWQFYSRAQKHSASEPFVETVDSPVGPSTSQSTGFQESADGSEVDATWQQSGKGTPRAQKRRGFGSKRKGKGGRALGKRGVTSHPVQVTSERDISKATQAVSEDEVASSEADEGASFRAPDERGRDRFLRVLFWKFRQLQMLLGSDLLLFGNDQHAAVSLHLMEVERQMSPLTWLDAWLDNMMANVPELAVCYHRKGVVQGYELLKTDDLFLLKGVGADGTISFHPQVVHANAAAVLQFLQDNCTSEPGAYWLVKNAGEDLMQLFDLSTISDDPDASDASDDEQTDKISPSCGPESYQQALALLIYRLALQLARSKAKGDQRRSGNLLTQCLELMEDKNVPDLLAAAHERVAKLCLQQAIRPPPINPQLLLEGPPQGNTAVKLLLGSESSHRSGGTQTPASAQEPHKASETAEGSSEMLVGRHEQMRTSARQANEALGRQETRVVEKVASTNLQEAKRGLTDTSTHELSRCEGESDVSVENSPQEDSESPAEAILGHASAVHHFSQAVIALRQELAMLRTKKPKKESAQKRVNREGSLHGTEQAISCKGRRHESRLLRTEAKIRKLLGHLAEAYLDLGTAYEKAGQLSRALKAAEVASIIGKHVEAETSADEETSSSETKQLENDTHASPLHQQQTAVSEQPGSLLGSNSVLAGVRNEIEQPVGSLELTRTSRQGRRKGSPAASSAGIKRGFLGSLWTFVGDLYAKLHQSWSEEELLSQRAALLSGGPRLADGVLDSSGNISKRQSKSAEAYQRLGVLASTSEVPRSSEKNVMKRGSRGSKDAHEGPSDTDMLCFGRPLSVDHDVNLTAAAESYLKAIAALEVEKSEKMEEQWQLTHRKLGWACNELGRRRLEEGDIAAAEGLFKQALTSFGAVKDVANAVLVYCNMGHARRRQAEAMAADVAKQEQRLTGDRLALQRVCVAHTSQCYRQALCHYIAARSELFSLGESEAQRTLRGLWDEVHTQLGHTYLCFGMFLSRLDEQDDVTILAPSKKRAQARAPESDSAPRELLTKALHLYESLGPARAQEAAYSHCQLAELFRDHCIGKRENVQDAEDGTRKRFAALADVHWQKALDFYKATSHSDMYISISIERSALALKCAPKSRPYHVCDVTLSHLAGVPEALEDQRSGTPNTLSETKQSPSKQALADLKRHLECLARELLQTHVSFLKNRSSADDAVAFAARERVSRLKDLYKDLLQAEESNRVMLVLRGLLGERTS